MMKLADVVFCVDCDRNLETYRSTAQAEGSSASSGPQRRMAVKKDANGDPLCVLCMDARRAKRNAAFMVRAGRAQDPDQQPGSDNASGGKSSVRPLGQEPASGVRTPRRAVVEWVSKVAPAARVQVQRVPSSESKSRPVATAKKKAPVDSGRTKRSKAKINKSAWIRSQPASMQAKDVLARATKSGIKLSLAQVYTARSTAKHKPARSNAALTQQARPERVRGPEARRTAALNELAFRRFVFSVGITRAEALLREIKRGAGS
jgi:hypothetical protein